MNKGKERGERGGYSRVLECMGEENEGKRDYMYGMWETVGD